MEMNFGNAFVSKWSPPLVARDRTGAGAVTGTGTGTGWDWEKLGIEARNSRHITRFQTDECNSKKRSNQVYVSKASSTDMW